jgi:hypothetical protein
MKLKPQNAPAPNPAKNPNPMAEGVSMRNNALSALDFVAFPE